MSRADHLFEDLKSLGINLSLYSNLEARELSLNLLAEQLLAEQAKCLAELNAIKKNFALMRHERLADQEQISFIKNRIFKLESTFPKPPHQMLQLALG